jgi:succinate-semialdehyde dehydrogenase / glutarate-semialdehyde dehydrogenase
MPIATINPATGETLRTFEPLTDDQLEEKLQRAANTFASYRRTHFAERSRWLLAAADILEKEQDSLGRLMATEMGKLVQAGRDEAAKCARACRYYAEHGEELLTDEVVQTDAPYSYIRYQPLGVVLAIMPWNFPFWQVFRFAAPGLMAGNVALLKHASNVPQCALAIEDVLRRAGFPEGAFQTLLIGSDRVGQVLADKRVAAATLTGSTPAGMQVAAQAGKLLKKTVLELGGSDPFIVMPSTDLEQTVRMAATARTINNGQSCIAAKRFIVHEKIYEAFTERFVQIMAGLKVGDPLDENTQVGPLTNQQILDGLDEQVQKTVAAGARALTGGQRLARPGYFYAPTVLAGIPPDAPAYHEELFGPVAALFPAHDIGDAIRQANDTPFGLGASLWSNDQAEQEQFVEEIESGLAFVNAMVASDPRLPFGGVKQSGYGRELGQYGIREFVNVKTISIHEQRRSDQARTE